MGLIDRRVAYLVALLRFPSGEISKIGWYSEENPSLMLSRNEDHVCAIVWKGYGDTYAAAVQQGQRRITETAPYLTDYMKRAGAWQEV